MNKLELQFFSKIETGEISISSANIRIEQFRASFWTAFRSNEYTLELFKKKISKKKNIDSVSLYNIGESLKQSILLNEKNIFVNQIKKEYKNILNKEKEKRQHYLKKLKEREEKKQADRQYHLKLLRAREEERKLKDIKHKENLNNYVSFLKKITLA